MKIKTLSVLKYFADRKRGVVCPNSNAFSKPKPAVFILNLQGTTILNLINLGLYTYAKDSVFYGYKNVSLIDALEEEIMKTKQAMDTLKKAFNKDSNYAWSWHCNLAMSAYDEGLSKPKANLAAARFMKLAFGIDMTKHEYFANTQSD